MAWSGLKNLNLIAKEPNSKVSYLAFPLGWGSEGHHAMLLKLSDSRLSYPC